MGFVTRRMHLVETLEGFPEQIGEEMFKKLAPSFRTFKGLEDNYGGAAVRVFSEAYQDEFLSSLKIQHLTVVDDFEDFLTPALRFCVKKLDVGDLGLARHDFLYQIKNMRKLESLRICRNNLNDKDLRTLFWSNECSNLAFVDLSGNPGLTANGVFKYLIANVSGLKRLKLTWTEANRSEWEKGFNARSFVRDLNDYGVDPGFENAGWFGPTVDVWNKGALVKDGGEKKVGKRFNEAQRFYVKPKPKFVPPKQDIHDANCGSIVTFCKFEIKEVIMENSTEKRSHS